MESGKRGLGIIFFSALVILAMMASYVFAENYPGGPNSITRGPSEVFNGSQHPPIATAAQAGNITQLTITGVSKTLSWQGYYGEITGTLTLDDAQSNTMFNWSAAEPQGEIYASNSSSVTWSLIKCFNLSSTGVGLGYSLTEVQSQFGMNTVDADSINNTFSHDGTLSDGATPHTGFYAGTYPITAGSCPAIDTFQDDSSAGLDFEEVILTDNVSIIFATLIENKQEGNETDIVGFDGATHDFQLIVPEDGTNDNTETTNYWFFVELS